MTDGRLTEEELNVLRVVACNETMAIMDSPMYRRGMALGKLLERCAELEARVAELADDRVCEAYIVDRARQYKNGSSIVCALEDLADDFKSGQHRAALKHGELDDLLSPEPPKESDDW